MKIAACKSADDANSTTTSQAALADAETALQIAMAEKKAAEEKLAQLREKALQKAVIR